MCVPVDVEPIYDDGGGSGGARKVAPEKRRKQHHGWTRQSSSNPDVDLLYDINGLAKDAPHWFDRGMEFVGEYGLLLALVLLVLWCWWTVRRRHARERRPSVGRLVWAPLAPQASRCW